MYEFPLIFFRTSISYRSQVYFLPSSVEAIDSSYCNLFTYNIHIFVHNVHI